MSDPPQVVGADRRCATATPIEPSPGRRHVGSSWRERADARHAARVIEHSLVALILPVVQDFGADQQDQQLQHEVGTHGGVSRGYSQRVSVGGIALPAGVTHRMVHFSRVLQGVFESSDSGGGALDRDCRSRTRARASGCCFPFRLDCCEIPLAQRIIKSV